MTKFSLFGDPFGASSRQKRRRTESQTPATPSTIVADGGGPSRSEGSRRAESQTPATPRTIVAYGGVPSRGEGSRRIESQTHATPSTIVADGGGPIRSEGSRRTESQTPATPSTVVADGRGPSRGEGSNTENGRREEHESGDSSGEDDEALFSEEDEEGDPEEEGEDDNSDGEGGWEDDEEELQEQRAEEQRGASAPDKSLTFTLTDTDVLDCAVCFEPLRSPIFQCENGHVACSSCCVKMADKCPSCARPIGYNRCRALEKVLESVRLSCKFSNYGCKETISYHKKQDHEKSCPYVPCHCPLLLCSFIGSSKQLARHFSLEHPGTSTSFRFNTSKSLSLSFTIGFEVLLEESEDLLFILTSGIDPLGNKITISCIGPSSKGEYLYDLVAKHEHSCLKLQTFTRSIQDPFLDSQRSPYLLIPTGFFGKAMTMNLDILIRDYHTRT